MGGKALAGLIAVLVLPAAALGAFPGGDPNESVRLNAPNDPGFDRCEPDNEGGPTCSNVFDQEVERFGFAPAGSQNTATYKNPGETARQQEQNTKAGRNPLGQIPGVSADRAWKRSLGIPEVEIAILDTGIQWKEKQLRTKIALNENELPVPQKAGADCASDDCNGDGAFNVDDYAEDGRVPKEGGVDDADDVLDGSDLIAAFSDGSDADSNGYVDDIAGWDFFDDDNNAYDASSYSAAEDHGTGRAEEAAAATNDDDNGTGVCPRCQIVPMRIWDTFVADTNHFAMASLYAADNDIEVVEGAVGGLFNSRFARDAFEHAYRRGVFFAIVSSDLNTANHNIPTLYDEAMQVQGTVADVHGAGDNPPEVAQYLAQFGIATNAPVGTWFRNSGTTQYGGHAHIVMNGSTGSQATGQAAGAAGLVASYARESGAGRLEPNEIKQLLTLTAEDVVPENTSGTGTPDPAQDGWDQHFGYGKPDLGLALERIADGKIPPQALVTSPEWFTPFNVERSDHVEIRGRLAARGGPFRYTVQWAPGIEPADGDFRDQASGESASTVDGTLATVDLDEVRAALDARPGGGATNDPTAPSKGPGDPDPNEPAFTVRVVVTDANGNRGEDRKMLFAYRDGSEHGRFGGYEGTGGDASQRLWDVDGDNRLDVVQADSSGRLQVLQANGEPVASFNQGRPVFTRPYPNVHGGAPAFRELDPPREVLRTPAIGDITGDGQAEIVDSAGEHVYAWSLRGRELPGFPVRVDPALSRVEDRTKENHVKRGFSASPALGDLDGNGALEIVIPALDQHLYVWDGRGRAAAGFPVKLEAPGEDLIGAEAINTAAVGDITGDGKPEIVAATNEMDDATSPGSPSGPFDLLGGFRSVAINVLANAIGGSGRIYALDAQGKLLPGWPVKPNGALPDALPFVGPGVDPVLGNADGDPEPEVIANVATGDVESHNADGSRVTVYDSAPGSGEHTDKSKVLNVFENPIVANLDSDDGLEVIKGGVTLNQLLNLGVTVGQNLPYNHVMQAWDASTGQSLPAYPQAVEDWQLLSSPSVADVSDAPGVEILAGTGLYYLRNLNASGAEGEGWPKFTGGWMFATPAVGDADGDGELEVTTITREGHSFMWDTSRPACEGNDEWWTSRHDEWSSGLYGTDTRPPGAPRRLDIRRTRRRAILRWIVPGDDGLCGEPAGYRVLTSRKKIRKPADGRVIDEVEASAAARPGELETRSFRRSKRRRYFAVMYRDDAGNWGLLAPRPRIALPLELRVRPRRVSLGRRCIRFRAISNGRPVARVRIRFADRIKRTNRRGRARFCVRLGQPGRRVANASRGGYRHARARVRVRR